MTGFEGIGDFDSTDPWERYLAHQAAKGNYPPNGVSPSRSLVAKLCDKLLPSGEVCGKLPGTCMHNWNPPRFGGR